MKIYTATPPRYDHPITISVEGVPSSDCPACGQSREARSAEQTAQIEEVGQEFGYWLYTHANGLFFTGMEKGMKGYH